MNGNVMYCGDNGSKMRASFKTFITKLLVITSVITWNKDHSSKQVVLITCTLGEDFVSS